MTDSRLPQLLHDLIDGWCERRALRPLAAILPGYLAFNGLTDGWHELWRAVNNARSMHPDMLTAHERAALAEARTIIYHALKANGHASLLDDPSSVP